VQQSNRNNEVARGPLLGRWALCGALSLLVAGPSMAEDWTNFGLGASGTRLSAEVSGPVFDAGGWRHQWTTEGPLAYRAFLASPAVGDGFVAFATQRNLVRVINELDGSLAWEAQAGGAVVASPAIWRGLVFVLGVNRQLYAWRLADGSLAWQKDLGAMGYASPVVVDGSVFVATGSPEPRLFRIDALTGQIRWQAGQGVLSASALASVAVARDQVIVGELEGRIHSFALADGRSLWTASTPGRVALSSPLVVGDRVYVLPGGPKAELFALELATGKPVSGWPVQLPMPAADTSRGALRARIHVTSSLAGSPEGIVFVVRADDHFGRVATGEASAFASQEVVFAVHPDTGAVLWSAASGRLETQDANAVPTHELLGTPALYRTEGGEHLVAVVSSLRPTLRIFSASGTERWSTALAGPARSSPVFANGRLLVGTDAGTIESLLSASNRPPVAPSLGLAPSGGLESNAARTTLRWGAAADLEGQAIRYTVRLDDDGEILQNWDLEVTTVAMQQSLDVPPLVPGRTYTFAVRARDSQGALSAWTPPQSFVAITSPEVTVDGQAAGSLREALASAAPGSMVRLGAGRYDLSSTLRLPPGVALSGAGPHLTTLSGQGLAVAVSAATGSTLSQLTVAGARVGVRVDAASEVRLRNIILRDNEEAGLDVSVSGAAELVSATVIRNGTGVRAAGPTRVRNALVIRNGVGLFAAAADLLESRYDNVTGNQVEDYRNVARGPGDLAAAVTFVSDDVADLRLKAAQPTTDRGDPGDDFALEPLPNGKRINIGAFGNTVFAELSPTTGTDPAPPAPMAADGGAPPPAGSQPDAGAPPNPEEPGGSGEPGENEPARLRGGGGCATGGSGPGDTGWLGLALAAAALAFSRRRRPPSRGIE